MKTTLLSLLLTLLVISGCKEKNNTTITILTDMGNIEVELYLDKAPITANHFLKNVDKNVFKEACFYRVVRPDNQPHNPVQIEVVQAGLFADELVDLQPTITHETTKETGLLHQDGTISMARNKPGSASTEFFICIGNQPDLDYGGKRNPDGKGFAAFGKVIKGMDLVKKIQQMKDTNQYLVKPLKINSITR